MKRIPSLLLLCGALAACMSAGVEVRPEQMSGFKHGVTTVQDVTTRLGTPSVETTLDDGSTLLVYTFVTSRPHPESFLPFIGPLVGGSDTRSSAAVFLFDAGGVLKSASTTNSNVGTGLSRTSSGAPAENVAAPAARSATPPAATGTAPVPSVSVEPLPAGSVEPGQEESVQPAPQEGVGRPAEPGLEPAPEK